MINKKLLTILIGLILISGAIALNIGESFTQTQYNNTNFDNIDFNMNITNSYIENDRLFIEFEYNTFEKQLDENGIDTNNFEVITKTERIPYYLGYYRDCRKLNSVEECNNKIIDFVYYKAEAFRTQEKVKLESQKTKEAVNELLDFDFKTLYINYDNYKINQAYLIGDIFVYENELYEVIQAHTSQEDWKPSQVPSLYKVKVLSEDGEIREWVQPISSVDCYKLGDKVTYNGSTWENTGHSCNIWAPGVFGWTVYYNI